MNRFMRLGIVFIDSNLGPCPHHGFSDLHQLDNSINALKLMIRIHWNSAAGSANTELRLELLPSIALSKEVPSSASAPSPVKAVEPKLYEFRSLALRNFDLVFNAHYSPRTYEHLIGNKEKLTEKWPRTSNEPWMGDECLALASGNSSPYYDPLLILRLPTLSPFGDVILLAYRRKPTLSLERAQICEAKTIEPSLIEPPRLNSRNCASPSPELCFFGVGLGHNKLPSLLLKELDVEGKSRSRKGAKVPQASSRWKLV
ncbi:hypothetical protein Tco_1122721 [Tanacetum coccineum]|uniref:Uncharacterized protein n=1 Tax=Tanacetum coccineum TaxID=301880 RepID=A0ABQ5J2E9_9ASTR